MRSSASLISRKTDSKQNSKKKSQKIKIKIKSEKRKQSKLNERNRVHENKKLKKI